MTTVPPRKRTAAARVAARAMFAAGALLALTILLVAVAWFGLRLILAQWLLDDTLTAAAPPGTTADVAALSPRHAILTDIEIPGMGRIARAEATFTIGGLIDGRIAVLTLERPALTLALDAQGQPSGPLRDWLDGAGESDGAIPVDRIVVDQGLLRIDSPMFWANLAIDGNYDIAGTDSGDLSWTLDTRLGEITGTAALSGLAGQDDGKARLEFASPRIGVVGAEAETVTGHAELSLGSAMVAVVSLRADATTLDGHPLGPLVLSGTWTGEAGSFDIDVGDDNSAATARLTAGYDGQADPATWSLAGLLAVALDLELPLSDPLQLTAPTRIELDLSGAVPQSADAGNLSGGGTISVTSQGVAHSQLSTGAIVLPLRADLAGQALHLGLSGQAQVSAISPAFDTRSYDLDVPVAGLDLTLVRQEGGTFTLDGVFEAQLRAPDGFAADVRGRGNLHLDGDGTPQGGTLHQGEVVLHGPLLPGIATGDLSLSGDGSLEGGEVRLSLDADGVLQSLSLDGITGRDVRLSLPLRLNGQLGGALEGGVQPVALIEAASLIFGDVALEKLLAELPLLLDYRDNSLEISLADTGWLDIGAIRHPALRTTANTAFKLQADNLPLFTLEHLDSTPNWDGRLVLAGTAIALDLLDGDGAVAASLGGTLPDIRVSGGRLGDHLQATAETRGGNLTVAGPDIALSGMEILLSYNDKASPWPQIQANGIDLRDLRSPSRFVPARADLAFKPVWPQGHDARASIDLHVGAERYMANIEASWEPARERLSAYVRIPPIRFSPALQPGDLSPLYGALLTDASGAIEIVGALGLDHDSPFAGLDFILDDLSGILAGAVVEDLAGRIHLSGLDPLRTPADQQLTAARFDPGLPMENLALSFSLPGNGAAWLSGASLELAGGTVEAQPTTYNPARSENRITLDVTGVQLSRLAELLEMPEIEASGRLAGSIPVLLADGDIAIEGGRLETQEPGVLRYLPEGGTAIAGGDEYMELVIDALSNFHYESLIVALDRSLGGASVVGLHITGANPEVYDGYPIQLNVNLTGDLDRIVRDSMAGWRIPDEIRKQLSGF